jgi:dTDP-4-dehydrorhamnose reductase
VKVLVVGGAGMLGHKLVEVLSAEHEVWTSVRGAAEGFCALGIGHPDRVLGFMDMTSGDAVVRLLGDVGPDAVVNAVGAIKQVAEGQDPAAGTMLNTLLPHRLAQACRLGGIRLVHISTDCVFAGSKGGYTEDDPADATDVYGRTKHLGEVTSSGCLTLRTSIIGRELRTSHGLVEWFMSRTGSAVDGFTRAVFSGVTTSTLARWVCRLLVEHPQLSGLYHAGAAPISKYDLLTRLKTAMHLDVEIRPSDRLSIDRSLNSDRFRAATGFHVPPWDDMVSELAAESARYERWRRR